MLLLFTKKHVIITNYTIYIVGSISVILKLKKEENGKFYTELCLQFILLLLMCVQNNSSHWMMSKLNCHKYVQYKLKTYDGQNLRLCWFHNSNLMGISNSFSSWLFGGFNNRSALVLNLSTFTVYGELLEASLLFCGWKVQIRFPVYIINYSTWRTRVTDKINSVKK